MKRGNPLTGLDFARLTFALLLLLAPLVAVAQLPPDDNGLTVSITTDRQTYRTGEPIQIRIEATNRLDRAQVLQFPSALQADYSIDNAYRWSQLRDFAAMVTTVAIGPHETYTFPVFTHQPNDYFVPAGRHWIAGNIGWYGAAGTTVFVGNDSIPPPSLLLSPAVSPSPAPFGAPVSLAVTVTNISSETRRFGHDGCPVHFTVDGAWTPDVACAEYWREVTLEPGASITFGDADYPYLRIEPPVAGRVFPPGWHSIELKVPGVGTTGARLQVIGGGGSISGTVITPAGEPLPGVIITAAAPTPNDSIGPPPAQNRAFMTRSDIDGRYTLADLPGDLYYVSASTTAGQVVWYPGVPTRDQAVPIAVSEGSAIEGIDFMLAGDVEPPPLPGVILARVVQALPPESAACCPPPIPGAIVAAIPVMGGVVDTGWVPPDTTGVPRGLSRRLDGPAPPVDPPKPLPIGNWREIYYGFADSLGQVVIRVPYGRYHLVAFTMGHRYQWWDHSGTAAGARFLDVDLNRPPQPDVLFELRPFDDAGRATATIAGQVRAWGYGADDTTWTPPPDPATGAGGGSDDDPTTGGSGPLAGAGLVARPLVVDPRIMTLVALLYPATSDSAGNYQVEVPANVPYVVQAWADGYDPQHFDHMPYDALATPVDVAPGRTTSGIDFDLNRGYVPPEPGAITGFVYHHVPGTPAGVADVIYPLADALVRVRSAVAGIGPHEMVARTDGNGFFRVDGLPMSEAGSWTYYVSAEAEGFLPLTYPNAFRWQDATPVAPSRGGQGDPIRLVLVQPPATGPHILVGLVRAHNIATIGEWPPTGLPPLPGERPDSSTSGGDPAFPYPAPDDTTGSYWPLLGAALYLVPADDPTAGPVAAGVACDNGTVVLNNLPPGRYRAYADFPGFETGWFHGTGPLDAAVIAIGPGIDPVLIDIVLESTTPTPLPGGGGDTADSAPRAVIELRNAPNPFRPQTTILYRLTVGTDVTVQIFDLNGRLVRSLLENQAQPSGEQRVPWDGLDDGRQPAGAGIYFYRIWTPIETRTGKMVMLR